MWQLTKEEQAAMTPAKAVRLLKEGNLRFCQNLKLNRNILQQINDTSHDQHPFAVILSCIDSRTSAELIFDQSLGDIYSIRLAGNVVNSDVIGSMEFACKISDAKLIAVIGHTKCGAILGACDNVKLGSLTSLIQKIQPAIQAEQLTPPEQRHAKNLDFVNNVARLNVQLAIKQITNQSPILNEMLNANQIDIVGGLYDISTGLVDFFLE